MAEFSTEISIDFEKSAALAALRRLEAIGGAPARRVLTRALRAGGKTIHKAAVSRAPRASGTLRRGIKLRARKRSRREVGFFVATPSRDLLARGGYGAKAKGAAKFAGAGARYVRSSGYYPAAQEYGWKHGRAQPYMRPALQSQQANATRQVKEILWQGIRTLSRR
jgi:HK97 gp10 family phage protein